MGIPMLERLIILMAVLVTMPVAAEERDLEKMHTVLTSILTSTADYGSLSLVWN